MIVLDLDYENLEYGFYVDGEYNFQRGDVFDKNKCLLDPYAKLISDRNIWGVEPDWEDDVPLKTPHNELIIYEAHVRGLPKKFLILKNWELRRLNFCQFLSLTNLKVSAKLTALLNYWGLQHGRIFCAKSRLRGKRQILNASR